MRKDYCVECGIAIQIPTGTIDNMILKEKPQEFSDGWRCYSCALNKVKKSRGQK